MKGPKLPNTHVLFRFVKNDEKKKQKTLMSPDISQLNQLFCLKLFCQIHFICTTISMGKKEKNKSHIYSVVIRTVGYFYRFVNMVKR